MKPVIFADETNLFSPGKEIKTLLPKTNYELQTIHECFKTNKRSLNEDKTNFL